MKMKIYAIWIGALMFATASLFGQKQIAGGIILSNGNNVSSNTGQPLTLATQNTGNIILSPYNSDVISGGYTYGATPVYPASNVPFRWGGGNRLGLFAGPDATANGVVDHVGGFGYNFQQGTGDVQMTLQMENWYKGTAPTAVSEFHYNWGGVIGGTNQHPRRIFQFTTSLGPDYGASNPISGWTDAALYVERLYVSKQGLYDDHGLVLDFSGSGNALTFGGSGAFTGNVTGGNFTTASGNVTATNMNVTSGALIFEISGGGSIRGSSGAVTIATASNANTIINNGSGFLTVTGSKVQVSKNSTTAYFGIGGGGDEILNIGADNGVIAQVAINANSGGAGVQLSTGGTPRLTASDSAVTISTSLVTTTHTPSSAGDTGTAGTVTWDASYVYVCIATNTWKRSALSSW